MKIKCPKCKTVYALSKPVLMKFQGKRVAIKCLKCAAILKVKITGTS